jgi:hypothetical protein
MFLRLTVSKQLPLILHSASCCPAALCVLAWKMFLRLTVSKQLPLILHSASCCPAALCSGLKNVLTAYRLQATASNITLCILLNCVLYLEECSYIFIFVSHEILLPNTKFLYATTRNKLGKLKLKYLVTVEYHIARNFSFSITSNNRTVVHNVSCDVCVIIKGKHANGLSQNFSKYI